MVCTVSTQKKRDKFENKLKALQENVKACNATVIRSQINFDDELTKYFKWLAENDCEGIEYVPGKTV